jgi:hypothetical protein
VQVPASNVVSRDGHPSAPYRTTGRIVGTAGVSDGCNLGGTRVGSVEGSAGRLVAVIERRRCAPSRTRGSPKPERVCGALEAEVTAANASMQSVHGPMRSGGRGEGDYDLGRRDSAAQHVEGGLNVFEPVADDGGYGNGGVTALGECGGQKVAVDRGADLILFQ